MRKWLVGAVLSLAGAGLLYTGTAAAQDSSEKEAASETRKDDRDVRVRRMIGVFAEPDTQIGVTIDDVDADDGAARGATVTEVRPDSPAEKAGIREGDIISEFDGERIRSARQLSRVVSETPPGRTVDVTVIRDGKTMALKVTPESRDRGFSYAWPGRPFYGAPPAFHYRIDPRSMPMPRAEEWFEGFPAEQWVPPFISRGRLGIVAQPLSDQLAQFFGTDDGVLVSTVRDDSPAAKAGLRAGDVITAVNGEKVESPSHLARLAAEAKDELMVEYVRDGKRAEAKVKLPPRGERGRRSARPV
ncbi:MAG TPA: PDZ domain-containing protein [Vicinamibacterales bacterium]|nr:PDZ domain-containing protein [Vicinamibacterales bacterium]